MPRVKRIAGEVGVPSRWLRGEGTIDVAALELIIVELPGVVGGGMPGRNRQRKTGTARGWPRRSRTAEASHISRRAVKLRCAREQGGWGRLSDDGRDSITEGASNGWRSPAGERPARKGRSGSLGSECCVSLGNDGHEAYTAIAWGVY